MVTDATVNLDDMLVLAEKKEKKPKKDKSNKVKPPGGSGGDKPEHGSGSGGSGADPVTLPLYNYEYIDGEASNIGPDCRCEHNVLMADTSVIQAWQDPLYFVVGASPFVVYPVSLFRGAEYEPIDLLKARVVDSYASLAHLFSLHEGINDAWGSTIARDLSTLPRNKKEMEVYIRSIQHKHENDWE